jgi:hypothetical protein
MRATVVLIVATMCMLPVLQLMTPAKAVENISFELNWFGNGKKTVLLDFPSGGEDDSLNISLQTGMTIDAASLNMSTVAQPAGSKDYPTNLTVNFGGDSKMEWQWKGQGYGQFGRQTTFGNGKDLMNVTLGSGGSTTMTIRLPKNADIRSATLNISVGARTGTPGKILIVYASGYSDCYNNAQSVLQAFNNDFSVVDNWDGGSSTPTLDKLSEYYSVLVWNHAWSGYRWADQNTLGNNLADYVDKGGGLVMMSFTFAGGWTGNVGGRFTTDNYYVIPWNNNGMSGSYPMTLSKTAGKENHPVFTNVTTVQMNDYMWCVQPNPGPGEELARWPNPGATAVAAKSVNGVDRVDLQMMPYKSGVNSWPYYCAGWTGDGDDLIKNSLLYAGRKPFTGTIDILNDSTMDFNQSGFQGNYTFPGLAQQLQDYLDTTNATFTDPFGTGFVDVPINVTAAMPAMVRFDNLEVLYDLTVPIDKNPANGDLVSALSDLQSSFIGTDNSSISMKVGSETAGQVKFHDLYLKISPPVHKPTINSFYPAATTVVKENSKLDFGIDVVDWYGNPMTIKWFSDGVEVPDATTTTFSRSFDYESAGNHTVKVAVNNGLSTVEQVWALNVLNVNRPPAMSDFTPPADPTIDENQTQAFKVNVLDPDKDLLSYRWVLDGKVQPDATGSSLLFTTTYTSAGDHAVKVIVTDTGGLWVGHNWTVHVNNVNLAPSISAWSPKSNPHILEKESAQFSVSASDPDGQTLVWTWYVDDVQAFVGNPFVYMTDYKSAGVHSVRATVSDGKLTDSHSWEVTVANVNRMPVAIIDSPTDAEFMQNAPIHFSALSSYDPDNEELAYSWKEGNVNVSDQADFTRSFPPGLHTITLEVRDRSGGMSSASVRFRVRYVEISVLIGVDRLELAAGDKVQVIVTLSNTGDAAAADVGLDVTVDGQSLGTKSYSEMLAGGGAKEIFTWKAVRGTHTITAKVGEQTWTKEVTVQKAAEVKTTTDYGFLWPTTILLVAVALVVFGAVAMRKK